tara:strand:+ start:6305 stop:7270 length:966 start_codon:yes stop_codon:yes gene_type:complete
MGTGSVTPGVVSFPKEEDNDSAFENFMEFMLEAGMSVGGAVVGGVMSGGNPYAIQAGAHLGHKLATEIIDEEPKIPTGLVSLGASAYAQVGNFKDVVDIDLAGEEAVDSVVPGLQIDQTLTPETQAMLKANAMHLDMSDKLGWGPMNSDLAVRMGHSTDAQVGILGDAANSLKKTSSELQDAMYKQRREAHSVSPTSGKPHVDYGEPIPGQEEARLAALAGQQVPVGQPTDNQQYFDPGLDTFQRLMDFQNPLAPNVQIPGHGTSFVNPEGRRTGERSIYDQQPAIQGLNFPGSPHNTFSINPNQTDPPDAFTDMLHKGLR